MKKDMTARYLEDVLINYEKNLNNSKKLLELGARCYARNNGSNYFIPELFLRRSKEPEAQQYLRKIALNIYKNKVRAGYSASEIDWNGFKQFFVPVRPTALQSIQKDIKDLLQAVASEGNVADLNRLYINSGKSAKELYDAACHHGYKSAYEGEFKIKREKGGWVNLGVNNKGLLEDIFNRDGVVYFHTISHWDGGKDAFVNWYSAPDRGSKCQGCGSTISELLNFYIKRKPKSGRGLSWEIDHIIPEGSYGPRNCKLVCYYCNNAKTDVFHEEFYDKKINIGGAIGRAIKSVLADNG